ncbi:MAG: hypothetical protein AAGG07_07095 [Planctomycetota bacterium]
MMVHRVIAAIAVGVVSGSALAQVVPPMERPTNRDTRAGECQEDSHCGSDGCIVYDDGPIDSCNCCPIGNGDWSCNDNEAC